MKNQTNIGYNIYYIGEPFQLPRSGLVRTLELIWHNRSRNCTLQSVVIVLSLFTHPIISARFTRVRRTLMIDYKLSKDNNDTLMALFLLPAMLIGLLVGASGIAYVVEYLTCTSSNSSNHKRISIHNKPIVVTI